MDASPYSASKKGQWGQMGHSPSKTPTLKPICSSEVIRCLVLY